MTGLMTYSVSELLLTPAFKFNRAKLAKFLKINRGLLGNYVDDVKCLKHIVILQDGNYTFMNKTRK